MGIHMEYQIHLGYQIWSIQDVHLGCRFLPSGILDPRGVSIRTWSTPDGRPCGIWYEYAPGTPNPQVKYPDACSSRIWNPRWIYQTGVSSQRDISRQDEYPKWIPHVDGDMPDGHPRETPQITILDGYFRCISWMDVYTPDRCLRRTRLSRWISHVNVSDE